MKGISKITVTNLTMQEAMQEYLNKRTVGGADKVTWIAAGDGGRFIVTTEEKETGK